MKKLLGMVLSILIIGMIPMTFAYGSICGGAIIYLDPSCQLLAGAEGGADVYACEGEDGTIFAICSSPTTMGGCAGPASNCAGGY